MRTKTLAISETHSVFFRIWESETGTRPRPAICVVHGLSEHSGRYDWLAKQFCQRGFDMVACDLYGHGKTSGQRGYVPQYEQLLEDIDRLVQFAIDEVSPDWILLYGHSMGGNLVTNYALRRRMEVNSLVRAFIVTSPMLETAEPPPLWKLALGQVMFRVAPRFSLSNGIDLTHLSRDPHLPDRLRNDPLRHSRLSAMLGISLIETGRWAMEHAELLDKPMLLMHGEDDRVTSCEASRLFAERAGDLCDFRSWSDARHELHHDLDREEVVAEVLDWISKLPDE